MESLNPDAAYHISRHLGVRGIARLMQVSHNVAAIFASAYLHTLLELKRTCEDARPMTQWTYAKMTGRDVDTKDLSDVLAYFREVIKNWWFLTLRGISFVSLKGKSFVAEKRANESYPLPRMIFQLCLHMGRLPSTSEFDFVHLFWKIDYSISDICTTVSFRGYNDKTLAFLTVEPARSIARLSLKTREKHDIYLPELCNLVKRWTGPFGGSTPFQPIWRSPRSRNEGVIEFFRTPDSSYAAPRSS